MPDKDTPRESATQEYTVYVTVESTATTTVQASSPEEAIERARAYDDLQIVDTHQVNWGTASAARADS